MKVFLVAGARPNFMKIAPIYRASVQYGKIQCLLIHTGQHYDHDMSHTFFDDLEIPSPDFHLNAGSGSHAEQTAKIMKAFEKICIEDNPDIVVLVGDVNSTLACSIVAKKLMVKVAHVEAGLRSFDMAMPEEINRIVTDSISDYFFVTEESGTTNLLNEGKPPDRIHLVGNVMIDNLLYNVNKLEKEVVDVSKFRINPGKNNHAFLTLHRPSNVDDKEVFIKIVAALNKVSEEIPIFFPVHPRTKKMIGQFDIKFSENIKLLPPLGFRDSLLLWKDSKIVLTDSGGLQEETTALGVPCVTIRENTERPITVDVGTNVIAGTTTEGIIKAVNESILKLAKATVPPLWDGRASERIWEILVKS